MSRSRTSKCVFPDFVMAVQANGSPSDLPPSDNSSVERYELLGELATGGMATVYLGRQRGALGHVETKGSFSTFWRQRPLRQMNPTGQAGLSGCTAR